MRLTSRENMDPQALKALYGVRFHHFVTRGGRLLATLATEPVSVVDDRSDTAEVAVSCAVCSISDAPSRSRGRQIALGRLEVGKTETYALGVLKSRIADRSILADFLPAKLVKRLGYESVGHLLGDLRPRRDFPTGKDGV